MRLSVKANNYFMKNDSFGSRCGGRSCSLILIQKFLSFKMKVVAERVNEDIYKIFGYCRNVRRHVRTLFRIQGIRFLLSQFA